MGCSNGVCGIAPASLGGACCDDCAANDYRQRMRSAFNPWQRNAGSNPAFNPYDAASFGGASLLAGLDEAGKETTGSTGTNAAAIGGQLGAQAINEIGATARTWIDADLERERLRTAREIAQARADAAAASGGQSSATQPVTSGGDNSIAMLAVLGLGAAFLSGMFKR